MNDRRGAMLALVAITAVGAALRLYGLDVQSLWNDELASWARATTHRWTELLGADSLHPPGHLLLLHFWTRLGGDSEVMLRLPSAIAGTLAIPATFVLGRKFYGEAEGLIAAAFMAVLWMPVYYSQEARAYALILLFATVSASCLKDIVGASLHCRQPSALSIVAYTLTAIGASYSHYVGFFLVALQGLLAAMILVGRNRAWRRLIAIYAVVLLAYAPVLWRSGASLATRAPDWMSVPTPAAIWSVIRFLFNRSDQVTVAFVALCCAALATQAWRRWDTLQRARRDIGSPTAILLLWVVAPIAILYARSVLVAPAFSDRIFIIVAPAAYLLVARAITALWPRRLAYFVTAAIVMALLVQLVVVNRYYAVQTKNQFREAAVYAVNHDDPEADVVVLVSTWELPYFNYYLEKLRSPRRVDRMAASAANLPAVLEFIDRRAPDQIWLLTATRSPSPAVIRDLKARFELIGERGFHTAQALRFRHQPRHH